MNDEAARATVSVAYQGVPAAFGEEAASVIFGAEARTLPYSRFDDVVAAVVAGAAQFGVLPIENTLVGSVGETFEALGRHDVRIVGETVLRVSHALIAPRGVRLADVRRVHSHPVALAQCESLFRAHPELIPVAAFNTAGAVRAVIAAGEPDAAAIGSARAAELYDGNVLLAAIEDHPHNFTRFVAVARAGSRALEGCRGAKTSLSFELAHRPGALAAVLVELASRGVDLTKIESRPIHGRPFEYTFFLDVRGDAADAPLRDAIAALRAPSDGVSSLRVLGSYGNRAERD